MESLVEGIKCELCRLLICKYELDVRICGATWHMPNHNQVKESVICIDCRKQIAREVIDEL